MTKQTWMVGGGALIVGLMVGAVLGGLVDTDKDYRYGYEYRDNVGYDEHRGHGMKDKKTESNHDMSAMMADMNRALEGKTGAQFDEAFLREMIIHHEGAVEMAKAALERAGDQRIKDLAAQIISAQEKEIADMKSWQSTTTVSGE